MAIRKEYPNKKDPAVENADQDLEASRETIDPRLDNRTGSQRPPLEEFPAKPQQIDGPDVVHTPTAKQAVEIAESNKVEDTTNRKGMQSPGPHGLGATYAPEFEEAVGRETGALVQEKEDGNSSATTNKKDTK